MKAFVFVIQSIDDVEVYEKKISDKTKLARTEVYKNAAPKIILTARTTHLIS